jgi:ribosome-binding factor A
VKGNKPTRRQEKAARVVRDVVSDAIANHLNDPRLTGIISVTKVEMMPDLRSADVYLSFFAQSESEKARGFEAINHARKRIQSLLGDALESKFCPVLRFHMDEHFQKTLETMKLIDEVSNERQKEADESGDSGEPDVE